MDTRQPLVIGYSGSLAWSDGTPRTPQSRLRDYFWTYEHHVTDPSTRSAYFLFDALRELKQQHKITAADIRVELWGKIDPRNQTQAEQMGIADLVQITGYLGKPDSLKKNASCDLLFLPMESATPQGEPLFIPGKVFEYMHTGKPVLALSGKCDCTDLLAPSGLMKQFDPRDKRAIAAWLHEVITNRKLLEDFAPQSEYISQFSFRHITSKLAAVFNEVLSA